MRDSPGERSIPGWLENFLLLSRARSAPHICAYALRSALAPCSNAAMEMNHADRRASARHGLSEDEWKARQELACACRRFDHFGWHELIHPGAPDDRQGPEFSRVT
jgi:hypothetical protein